MNRLPGLVLLAVALAAVLPACAGRAQRAPETHAVAAGARAGADAVAARARQWLASRLGVAPDTLRLVAEKAVTWSDSSLGCPERGKLYLQVITPGWRLRFEGPGGTIHEVHTNRDASHWVLCPRAAPTVVPEVQ